MWKSGLKFLWIGNLFWFLSCADLMVSEPENPLTELQVAQGRDVSGKVTIDTALHAFNNFNRRCETRIGNLIADGLRERGESQLAIMNGGGIRPLDAANANVLANNTVNKGELTREQVNTILLFPNTVTVVRVRGFRLKQMLEHSAAAVTDDQTAAQSDDHDEDGAIHGDCRNNGGTDATASGGFLHYSRQFSVVMKIANDKRVTNGETGLNTRFTAEGKRVTKIVLEGNTIYENADGDITSGWAGGSSNCTIKGISYTASSACSYFTITLSNFYASSGGDNFSMLAPSSAEVANDGSVAIIRTTSSVIGDVAWEYLKERAELGLLIKPEIEGRIVFE